MKVLYDARFITPQQTGIGVCVESELKALLELSEKRHFTILYYDPIPISCNRARFIKAPVPFDAHPLGDLYRNINLVRLIKQGGIDLIHNPAFYSIQRQPGACQITSIHDMAVFDFPEAFPRKFVWYFTRLVASSIRNSARIVASSEFVKKCIINRFPESEEKIRIIPYGIREVFFQPDAKIELETARSRCLPEQFILVVATIDPRKNLLNLLDGYAIYRRRYANPIPLIIVGKDGFLAKKVKDRAAEHDLEASVRFLGFVSVEEIAAMYRLATMSVYPSLYEGFGLPILEAMASGCPVITSNLAAMPEVAGGASLLVDPRSPVSIANAIMELSFDAQLRNDLRLRGAAHARSFKWKETAERILRLYDEVLERGDSKQL